MKLKILYFCLISGVNVVTALIQVTGYIGRSAVIRCPYDKGYESKSKYLCRGSCRHLPLKDKIVKTDAGQTRAIKGRFSLHDNGTARIFTVTITGLTSEDSGQYWCGVKTGFGRKDVYTELKLDILPAPEVTDVSSTIPDVTDVPSTSALVTTNYFVCEDCMEDPAIKSQQPDVNLTHVLVGSGAAGLAVLLIISVALGCRAAKRNKNLEMPDDRTLSQSALTTANIYADTEATREGNTPCENDPVYECLELKECGPDAEYERLGALANGRAPLGTRVNGSPGKGKEKDTLSNKKCVENEYESMRDIHCISKANKGAEN